MARIVAQQPDVQLVLAGGRDAAAFAQLKALIEQSELPADRVIDFGYVSDSQLRQLYQEAEALLFVSEHEGFGMPLVEAMREGCPVICAPLTAIPEVVGDAGLRVDSDEPDAWAQAFLTQLPEQRAALIQKGQQRAALFTWQRTRDQWRTLLEESAPQPEKSGGWEFASAQIEPEMLARLQRLSSGIEPSPSRRREFAYLLRHSPETLRIRATFYRALTTYASKSK